MSLTKDEDYVQKHIDHHHHHPFVSNDREKNKPPSIKATPMHVKIHSSAHSIQLNTNSLSNKHNIILFRIFRLLIHSYQLESRQANTDISFREEKKKRPDHKSIHSVIIFNST